MNQTVSGHPPTAGVQSGWTHPNANNQIDSNNFSPVVNDLTYDAAGNNTYDGISAYKYDAEGRVCSVLNTNTHSNTQYFYGADGIRIAKADAAGFTCSLGGSASVTPSATYVLGPSGEKITEFDGTGTWKHTNIFAGGQLLATYDRAGLHFPLSDTLGTVRVQASGMGIAEESFSSLPYGDGMVTSSLLQNAPIHDATEHHFTGKERDQESGLDNFGARYYGSNMGRFMSPDPSLGSFHLENPQSLNRYAYVLNNPLIFTDPDGLDCIYTSNLTSTSVSVETVRGDCRSDTDNGVFVDGTVNTDSYKAQVGTDGDVHLGYGFTNDNSGVSGSGSNYTLTVNSGTTNLGPAVQSMFSMSQTDRIQQLAQQITGNTNPNLPYLDTMDPNHRLGGTHYCGPGGGGGTTGGLDQLCAAHDACYRQNGVSAANNFNPFTSGSSMGGCDRLLCAELKNYSPTSGQEARLKGQVQQVFGCGYIQ